MGLGKRQTIKRFKRFNVSVLVLLLMLSTVLPSVTARDINEDTKSEIPEEEIKGEDELTEEGEGVEEHVDIENEINEDEKLKEKESGIEDSIGSELGEVGEKEWDDGWEKSGLVEYNNDDKRLQKYIASITATNIPDRPNYEKHSVIVAPGESVVVQLDFDNCDGEYCKRDDNWYTTLNLTSLGGELDYSYNSIGKRGMRRVDGGTEVEESFFGSSRDWSIGNMNFGGMSGRINQANPVFLYRHFEYLTMTNDSTSPMEIAWEDGENYNYLEWYYKVSGDVDVDIKVEPTNTRTFTRQVVRPGETYTINRDAEITADYATSRAFWIEKNNGESLFVSYRFGSEIIATPNAKFDIRVDTYNGGNKDYDIPPVTVLDAHNAYTYNDYRYHFKWDSYLNKYNYDYLNYGNSKSKYSAIRIKIKNTGDEDIIFLSPYEYISTEKDELGDFDYEELYINQNEVAIFERVNEDGNTLWMSLMGDKQGENEVLHELLKISVDVIKMDYADAISIDNQWNNIVTNSGTTRIRVAYPTGTIKYTKLSNFDMPGVIKRKAKISNRFQNYIATGSTSTSNYITVSGDERSLVSDPVDTATGAFTASHDLIGLPIYYYSSLTNNGSVGRGWEHIYDARISGRSLLSATINWSENRSTEYKSPKSNNIYTGVDRETSLDTIRVSGTTITLTQHDGTKYVFANNYLKQIITRTGKVTEIVRDSRNKVIEIQDKETNQTLYLSYNSRNKLAKVKDDAGREVNNIYDIYDRLIGIRDANGNNTTYTYGTGDTGYKILSSIDNEGNSLFVNTYDEKGRVIQQDNNGTTYFNYTYDLDTAHQTTEVVDRNGNSKRLVHDNATFQLIEYEDELGNVTKSIYNFDGTVSSKEDENGNKTQYFYDKRKNLTRIVDAQGNETTFEYDDKGNITKSVNAGKTIGEYTYTVNNLLETETDGKGNTTRYTYTEDNKLKEIQSPDGGVTKYTYDGGDVKTITDPTGVMTAYEHDAIGRVIATIDSKGNRAELEHDRNGNLLRVKDALNNATEYVYDSRNRLRAETDSKGAITEYEYDTNNNLKSVIDAKGNVVSYTYDKEDNLVGVTDGKGNTTEFIRDGKGRLVAVKDPLGNTQSYQYDNTGNLVTEKDAYGVAVQEYEYDSLNNLTSHWDSLGNKTLIEYNQWSDVTKTVNGLNQVQEYAYHDIGQVNGVTDANGNTSTQEYNNMGQVISVTDVNGNKTKFRYDLSGRVTGVELENGITVTYKYNELGQLSSKVNGRGQEFTFEYDKVGRNVKTVKTEGTVITTYDENGNVLTEKDEAGTVTYKYDELNRIVSYTDIYGNKLGYTYDANDNLLELKYPDGKTVKYTYDNVGNLKTVTDWKNRKTAYEYDKNNRLVKTTRPNGTVEKRNYDTQGQLLSKIDYAPNGTKISEDLFTYNGVGNITTEQTELNGSGESRNYEYDSLNRVTGVSGDNRDVTYTYDKQGNILTVTGNEDELSMTYGTNNWLTSVNGTAISYDNDGNALKTVVGGEGIKLQYDSLNRLIRAGDDEYGYDVNNSRVRVVEQGVETRFVVNPNAYYSQLLMETDELGKPTKYYVYGLGLISEESADGSYKVFHYDYRGSTIALTDEDGEVTDTYVYGTYGELEGHEGTSAVRFRYNGRDGVQTDSTGLYYMRARYYNPEIKRFINQDVLLGGIEDSTSLNRYSYVNGNPVNHIDPFGLEAQGANAFALAKEIASFVPGLGNVISVYDSIQAFNKGDIKSGIINLSFAVPGIGNVAKAGKLGVKGAKYFPYGIDKLKGVKMMNKKMAGTTYKLPGELGNKYPNGVKYDDYGFPDYSPYSRYTVKLDNLKGNNYHDFKLANEAVGLPYKGNSPPGYTWHHVEDGKTMMLVPKDLHRATSHTGGAALLRKGIVP